MSLQKQNHIGIFLIILVIAAILRFYGLDRLSLWADELWVVVASVSGSLPDMIKSVYYHDNHPPGHYLLVRYTQLLLGASDFAIRLPSALAGIALVAATYVTGKKAFSAKAAVIASALVAGSYQAIYYSQEARPNIFVALFALLAFHYFRIIVLERDRAFKNYFLFWIAALGCSYFHYAGLVFCACLGLVLLISVVINHNKDDFISGVKLFLPVILLYLPWVLGTFRHLVSTPVTAWQRPPNFNTLATTFRFLFGPDSVRIIIYQIVVLVTLVILVVAIYGRLNKKSWHITSDKPVTILYMLMMMVLPVAVFYIKSIFSQDAYNHRHFLYAIPLMALLAGYYFDAAISRFAEQKQTAIFFSVVIVIILYQLAANNGRALYSANHFKQEYREAAQVAADDPEVLKNNDIVVVTNSVFFDHYLKRFTEARRKSDFIYNWYQQVPALQSLLTERHSAEFYYLEAPLIPGANNMITAEDLALIEHYQPLCRTRFNRAQVFKFSINHKSHERSITDLPDCRQN